MTLIISRDDLEKILDMKEVIDVIEKAFAEMAKGKAIVPLRPKIFIEKYNGAMLYMPAYLSEMDALSIKIVSVFTENINKGLPTIYAIVIINDPRTGKPVSIIEGGYLTAMRTGAATGVATKYLAREDASIVGILGTGTQAVTQLWAVKEVRDIEKVYAYDIVKERANNFAEEMHKKFGLKVQVTDNPKDAVINSDIVILATTAVEPVINGDWIRSGMHINSIGWMGRDARELDSKTIKMAKVVVDSREAVLEESGDLIIPINEGVITPDHIYAELGEIIIGKKEGRVNDKEITLWKSVGLAIQDAAIGKLAYEKALRYGIGTDIKFI